jgi:glycosyltransferase involved in cell wall biosynthesis
MKQQAITSLIITTFNELPGLKSIWPRIPFDLFDEVLVIDRNSTDGTQEFLREMGTVPLQQMKPGRGNAIREAISRVHGDVIVLTSSDGNEDPRYFPELLKAIFSGCRIAAGSRFAAGIRSDNSDDPFRIRVVGNLFFTFCVNLIWRTGVTDAAYGMRAFTKNAWTAMGIMAEKNETEFLMSIRAGKLRIKICEIPVSEGYRVGGTVKAKTMPVLMSFVKVLFHELRRR